MSKLAIITGGNGAVGFGIAQRLLLEIPGITILITCRSIQRGNAAKNELISRCFPENPEKGFHSIHVLKCDLNDSKSVLNFCDQIKSKYSVVDFLFLNAGIMPAEGIDIMTGIRNLITRPSYVAKTGGDIITQRIGQVNEQGMGTTFASNVFGHFLMLRKLQCLLEKSTSGLVLWCSSTTADPQFLDANDFQCIHGKNPYESSKRLCELLSMALYNELSAKNVYSFVTSPGNVSSGIIQGKIHPWLLLLSLYIMRLFGCSGINITGENAATSAVELAKTTERAGLSPFDLYHSEINLFGTRSVKTIPLEQDMELSRLLLKEMDLLVDTVCR